ncbi:MAG: RagB/SusD family nutrient uptake outer membrane protein [Prevotella sp.]|nr:RagB/SusD family nutrient uptake outer membrane protein [Prevotella sp.]
MKLRLFILPAMALLTCASCVDLDYSEVTNNDEEWVYQSPVYGIQRLATSVYAHIPNGIDKNFEGGSGATFAAACDEADCALSNSNVRKFYNGGWSPINPFGFTWQNSYAAIAEANNFLEKMYRIDLSAYSNNNDYQAMKNKFELFEYEVRFLRAYFYFELVRAYGDVPFTLKTLTNDEANSMTRTPAITIMDWIVSEMDIIAEFLPITYATELNTDIGRATRPMCLALKARTLLYKASPLFNTADNKQWWLDAARANHDLLVKASGWGIKLGKYADIWGPKNGDAAEMIFVSKQGALSSWERYNYPIGVENGQSGMCPTQTLVDAYEYMDSPETFGMRHPETTINLSETDPYEGLDPRFAMTVVKNGDMWPNYNTRPIETFEGGYNASPLTNSTLTGYYLKKYCDPSVNISTNDATETQHAWVLMRLGEFYLNYAEAMFNYYGDANTRGEFTMSANDAVNIIRNREDVKMPKWTGNTNWKARYERERMVELAFEDHRFWDIRRWKQGESQKQVKVVRLSKNSGGDLIMTRSTLNRGWNDKFYFFPIPFDELNKNKNLSQNTGWDNK